MSAIMEKKYRNGKKLQKSLLFWIFCPAFKIVDRIKGLSGNISVNIIHSEPIGEIFIFILVFEKIFEIADGVKWVYFYLFSMKLLNDNNLFLPHNNSGGNIKYSK